MKFKVILLSLILISLVFTGCTKKNNPGTNTTTTPEPTTAATTAPTTAPTTAATTAPETTTTPSTPATDVVTTASIVNTPGNFVTAVGTTGTWIIAILQDLTIDQDVVVDGTFKNGKKDTAGKEIIQRKLAFYSQDADRNITARYTLSAPKMTIKSPECSIQHGTFKGDLYVDVDNFQLIDAMVDGNIYFTKQSYKDTFTMDSTSKVTGAQSVQ